ncbi:hypothetical protein B296_00041019 [Ensete ventricosum]|uniref:Uncharacterized protein n=1 Tax=Ensete ventricosum TaxID=4639 RepID=A0A426XC48_ENSVE|nr:hypothetical protein B296_00041019 [Ensete ventricosum]
MHPLRFPNSGIRAKVFVQKIGFKLCVMILNRVELFYVLVAAIGSESRRCLHAEVAGHGQAPYRGGRPWPSYWQGAVGCGQASYKGRPPKGAAARKGRPPAGTTGCGQPERGCHPRPALPPAGAVTPVIGVAAPWQGGCRPQRAVVAYIGAAATVV